MAILFQRSQHTLIDLAKALGLEGRHIVRIIVDVGINDIGKVEIHELLDIDHSGKICEVIRRYKLHEVAPAELNPGARREFL